jgi:hypothetical protein
MRPPARNDVDGLTVTYARREWGNIATIRTADKRYSDRADLGADITSIPGGRWEVYTWDGTTLPTTTTFARALAALVNHFHDAY